MKIAGIANRKQGNAVQPISSTDVLAKDRVMKELMAIHPVPRIGQNPMFFSLVRAIVSQQLSEAAASTIFKRLSSNTEITPVALSCLDVEAFRACGISFRKADYIKGIAAVALNGQLEHIADLGDEDALKELVKLKGVGRWTAEMILIFSMGREDVWPCDDAGLLRIAKKLYGTANVQEFIELGERGCNLNCVNDHDG